MTGSTPLARRLGTADAVWIGLASMIGAGIFSAFAPAAASAGGALLIALAIAAVVATTNAISSASLAAQYPTSGGTYVYGRERLGPWWGHLAGWSFVIGKTASCAAMALTFAAYAVPQEWQRPAAAVAMLVIGGVSVLGVTRTARVARILVLAVLAVLVFVVASGLGWAGRPSEAGDLVSGGSSVYGVLQAAGLLFFAFAGYARIATLGEEVRDPRRTIPRAILIALGAVLVIYAVVGATLVTVLGEGGLAGSSAPLAAVVALTPWPDAVVVVRIGAAIACLGALLALTAGVSRTALAMGREGDLPRFLAGVSNRHGTPRNAELVVTAVVVVLVLTVDLRSAIGFSSFGVLLYYLVANLSAFTQDRGDRLAPRAVAVLGAVGCVVLAAALPVASVVGGLIVVALGLLVRLVAVRVRARSGERSS
ncbi:APC family permease [Amnibacterium flavum]|uniref:Amino acid permease n=1 Tax=Amnibacterium flavum TaxID=2173173 RepID=A0A2V1HSR8_9MICO|nr:APC family permease [Amnibacterium flavum]PVZ94089.1 amino acid permease [Amnibacterium flavum]